MREQLQTELHGKKGEGVRRYGGTKCGCNERDFRGPEALQEVKRAQRNMVDESSEKKMGETDHFRTNTHTSQGFEALGFMSLACLCAPFVLSTIQSVVSGPGYSTVLP